MIDITPGWLSFYSNPSKPKFILPKGAVDTHCHVFGPHEQFPYAPERKYTPTDAPKEKLFELHKLLGFERSVIVQATCHGTDNRALIDALDFSNGTSRGVALVKPEITLDELAYLHDKGVRGVRFNFLKRLVEVMSREAILTIAKKIKNFGWHAEVYFAQEDLVKLKPLFLEMDLPIVVDHLGRLNVNKPLDGEEFSDFCDFMASASHIWCKVSCPERLSHTGPPALDQEKTPYKDVIPFAKQIIESFSDRVVFGIDWPHPNLKVHVPDDGLLVDMIPHIAPTTDLQHKLLVGNPERLYWAS